MTRWSNPWRAIASIHHFTLAVILVNRKYEQLELSNIQILWGFRLKCCKIPMPFTEWLAVSIHEVSSMIAIPNA